MRDLHRSPGFTLLASGTMALGIGATVTVFGIVDGVLLRPLPYPEAGALVAVGFRRDDGRVSATSGPFLEAWRAGSRQLAQITGAVTTRRVLQAPGEPAQLEAASVSASYFSLFGVPLAAGSGFPSEYDARGAPHVVVLSHALWSSRWGRDPEVIGRTITLNDTAFTVVGVIDQGFRPPEALGHEDVDLWTPLGLMESHLDNVRALALRVAARLVPGATLSGARAELQRAGAGVVARFPAGYEDFFAADVRPLHDVTVGTIPNRVYMLLGAVTLLLMIASTNVANLFLARGTDRVHELTIRAALGASRLRVARLVLLEAVSVAMVGCTVGAALAFAGLGAFRRLSPGDIPRLAEVAVDGRVLGFAITLASLTGVLFGIAPAFAATRRSVHEVLNATSRTSTGRDPMLLRGGLIVAEVASAVVLCVGAGLLFNSFLRLSTVDPGFDPSRVETVPVRLGARYPTQDQRLQFFDRTLARVKALPGVAAATLTADLPMGGEIISSVYLENPATGVGMIQNHAVSPSYFVTFGMTLRPDGRSLPPGREEDERAVVVNEAFVRRYWPDGQAIGKRIKYDEDPGAPWFEVVGVVNDVRFSTLAEPPEPQVYYPYPFVVYPLRSMYVAARTAPGTAPVAPAIRDIVRELDPALPVAMSQTMSARLRASVAEPRFYTTVLMTFAVVAVALACVGIYATMSYLVSRRSREMGIRMALGAPPAHLVRLVAGTAGGLAAAGAALGLAAAAGMSRVLSSFLFGITPTDPWTFGTAAAFLCTVAVAACVMPARRAARIDPVRTLVAE